MIEVKKNSMKPVPIVGERIRNNYDRIYVVGKCDCYKSGNGWPNKDNCGAHKFYENDIDSGELCYNARSGWVENYILLDREEKVIIKNDKLCCCISPRKVHKVFSSFQYDFCEICKKEI